ncbi:MAG TPA: DUF4249 domain-containing protein [Bacteroidetes bacterium]|nr:DUF4249 domain-containing protein [Bacteroidota bacterium]
MMRNKITNPLNKTVQLSVRLLLLASVAFYLQSCTERIDIKTDVEFQKLAVEGNITPEHQYVKLQKTSGYFSQEAPPAIDNATVSISSGGNVYLLNENPEEPGTYVPDDTLPTAPGTDYKLTIDLPEPVGGERHFESETVMPTLNVVVDSIRVIYRGDFEHWIIKLYAYEPPGPDYYMFNALRNDTILTDSLSRIGITDDRLVDGMYLPGIYVLFFNKDELAIGDTVTLLLSGISKDYFRFLDEAQQELQPNVPFFSGPPANVRSNINNGALGYFSAYSSIHTSTIIDGSGNWE